MPVDKVSGETILEHAGDRVRGRLDPEIICCERSPRPPPADAEVSTQPFRLEGGRSRFQGSRALWGRFGELLTCAIAAFPAKMTSGVLPAKSMICLTPAPTLCSVVGSSASCQFGNAFRDVSDGSRYVAMEGRLASYLTGSILWPGARMWWSTKVSAINGGSRRWSARAHGKSSGLGSPLGWRRTTRPGGGHGRVITGPEHRGQSFEVKASSEPSGSLSRP